MPGTVTGNNQRAVTVLVESAEEERGLRLQSLMELKIITRHLAEIAGATFGEDDIELEDN